MQTNSSPDPEIVSELYRTLVLLGADHALLGTVGSWGNSLPESEVLANLRGWNQETLKEITARIESYEVSCSAQAYSPVERHRIAAQAR
jgi:hypothetical protein